MGHTCPLQTRSSSSGHGLPSYLSGVMTVTMRFWTPLPQVFEQADHAFHE
jgi:hypothetical protein